MERLDRALQRQILVYLRGVFPDYDEDLINQEFGGHPDLWGNVKYLQEHGLLSGTDLHVYGKPFSMHSLRLTSSGLDFLENDGGIEALRGMRRDWVDLAEMKRALEETVRECAMTDTQKNDAVALIRGLTREVLEQLLLRGIEQVVRHPHDRPNVIT